MFLLAFCISLVFSMADQSSAAQVVYPKINGKNYASWAFAMQIDIGGREQLGYIDGRLLSQAKVIPNRLPGKKTLSCGFY